MELTYRHWRRWSKAGRRRRWSLQQSEDLKWPPHPASPLVSPCLLLIDNEHEIKGKDFKELNTAKYNQLWTTSNIWLNAFQHILVSNITFFLLLGHYKLPNMMFVSFAFFVILLSLSRKSLQGSIFALYKFASMWSRSYSEKNADVLWAAYGHFDNLHICQPSPRLTPPPPFCYWIWSNRPRQIVFRRP